MGSFYLSDDRAEDEYLYPHCEGQQSEMEYLYGGGNTLELQTGTPTGSLFFACPTNVHQFDNNLIF